MKLYDMHTHTFFSHDSKAVPEEMVKSAIDKGLSGIAFTEHCDVDYFFYERNSMEQLGNSIETSKMLNDKYKGKTEVLCGLEISGSFRFPEITKDVLDNFKDKVDAILCSVHVLDRNIYPEALSQLKYSSYSVDEIKKISLMYYDDILEMMDFLDGEILCHLTYLGRYINLVYGISDYSYSDYLPKIKEILKVAAKKDMALEVNTSNMAKFKNGFYMVDRYILELFRECGGKLVSLGSDAHCVEHVGTSFADALSCVKEAGFNEYCYFKKRQPVLIQIK